MASSIGEALDAERLALREQGGVTDGALATNVARSTPRSPADVRPQRVASRDPEAFPPVTGREEEWRFTPVARLRPLLDGPPSGARLQVSAELPAGVTLRQVGPDEPVLGRLPLPLDRLGALAVSRSGGGLLLTVPAGASVADPVVLRLAGPGSAEVAWGHLVVDLGAGSRATVVLEHTGDARYAGAVSVLVGDEAVADLVSVQEWDRTTLHAGHLGLRVGRDARVRATEVTLGGDVVRRTTTVDYAGPGGEAELLGLTFADAGQHLESRLFVDHAAPSCRSRVTYKSAVQGEGAHTVWVGDVLIRAGATGTDTYELNRNLLLSPQARADSVPNLEIETGEIVGAGHASATGRFDDEQLFYLQSRGISAEEARRMVVRGFFADILQRVGVPWLEERLLAAVESGLERTAR